jgi:hypothetical protein
MGYGLGKAMQFGVEYEVLGDNLVELTSADEMRLAKMIVAFQGKVVETSTTKPVQVSLPKPEKIF